MGRHVFTYWDLVFAFSVGWRWSDGVPRETVRLDKGHVEGRMYAVPGALANSFLAITTPV